jgi:hypothetical protein
MRCQAIGFAVAVTATAGVACNAQSSRDFAAWTALVLTPVGALPPIMTSTIASEVQTAPALSFRYGHLPSSIGLASINSGGATVIFPVGQRSTVSLTGGFFDPTCRDCDAGLMLGVAGDTRLGEMPFGTGRERSRLTFGLNGELGYARPKDATFSNGSLVSGAVGIPIGLVSGGPARDAMRIVPFLTPGFGFGGIRDSDPNPRDEDLNGTRFMLGGGLGLYNRSSTVSLTVGFQYVAIRDADTQFGVALTLGGR